MMSNMDWLKISYNNALNIGEIYIYGLIMPDKWDEADTTPTTIKNDLAKLSKAKSINLYVNSNGGDVFSGLAIYNILQRVEVPIIAYIDGIAASIASVIIMAAKKIIIPKNAMIMIHNPTVGMGGDASELRKTADVLDRLKTSIISTYATRSKRQPSEISQMMDEETWMNGDDAIKYGFADEIAKDKKIAACYRGSDKVTVNGITFGISDYKTFPGERFGVAPSPANINLCNARIKLLKQKWSGV